MGSCFSRVIYLEIESLIQLQDGVVPHYGEVEIELATKYKCRLEFVDGL